jgi:predicted ATPase
MSKSLALAFATAMTGADAAKFIEHTNNGGMVTVNQKTGAVGSIGYLLAYGDKASRNDDAARRFIALVDEFYERKVKLILSAALPLEQLYSDGKLNFEFRRCISRLQEMQSHQYLALAHKT